jgi:hypothetical protein
MLKKRETPSISMTEEIEPSINTSTLEETNSIQEKTIFIPTF